MTNYANGDTGSDRAYEYEQERDAAERDAYVAFCEDKGIIPDHPDSDDAYQIFCEEEFDRAYRDFDFSFYDIPSGTPDSWIPDNPDDNGMRMSDFI